MFKRENVNYIKLYVYDYYILMWYLLNTIVKIVLIAFLSVGKDIHSFKSLSCRYSYFWDVSSKKSSKEEKQGISVTNRMSDC